MTGMDLYRELHRSLPEVVDRLVFMTGGAFTPAAEEFLRQGGHRVIDKPFDIGAIVAMLPARHNSVRAPASRQMAPSP